MLDTEKVAKRAAAAAAAVVPTDCEKKKRAARGRDSTSLSWLAETADGTETRYSSWCIAMAKSSSC